MLSRRVLCGFVQVTRSTRAFSATPCCALQQKDVTQDKGFQNLGKNPMQAKEQEEHGEGVLKRAMDKMSNLKEKAKSEYDPSHPVSSTMKATKDVAKDVAHDAKEAVKSAFETVKGTVSGTAGAAKHKVEDVIGAARETVHSGTEKMKEMARDTGGKQPGTAKYQDGPSTSKGTDNSVGTFSKDSTYAAPGNMDYDPAEDSDRYHEHWTSTASSTMKNMKEGMKDTADNLKEGFKGAMKDAKDKTMEKAEDVKERVKETAQSMKENVKETAQSMKETMQDKWESTKGTAKDAKEDMKEGWSEMKDKAKEMKDEAKDRMGHSIEKTLKRGQEVSQRVKEMYTGTEEDSKGGSGFNRMTPDQAKGMFSNDQEKPKSQGSSSDNDFMNARTRLNDIYEAAPPEKAGEMAAELISEEEKWTVTEMAARMDNESGKEGFYKTGSQQSSRPATNENIYMNRAKPDADSLTKRPRDKSYAETVGKTLNLGTHQEQELKGKSKGRTDPVARGLLKDLEDKTNEPWGA